jgi:hypothetical protein
MSESKNKGLIDRLFPKSDCCSDVKIVPKKDLKKQGEDK